MSNLFIKHKNSLFWIASCCFVFLLDQSNFLFFKTFFIHFMFSLGYAMTWNLLASLSGQYSFGHAVYAGIGAYLAALAFNISTGFFILMIPFILIFCAAFGAGIAFMSGRFKVEHAYFTLLTIVTLECVRIFFENTPFFNGTSGLFLISNSFSDMIYQSFCYVIFIFVIFIFFISKKVFKSNLALKCIALKDNKPAAESIGIHPIKNPVIIMGLSTALTALLGVLSIFYQKQLFPEQIFSMQRSMHMVLPALIGGVGNLLAPLKGALIIAPLSELLDFSIDYFDFEANGLKHIIFGSIILWIIIKPLKKS